MPYKSLESVRDGPTRFPHLAQMLFSMPCQVLHALVPVSLPRAEDTLPPCEEFSSLLTLTSTAALPLAAVTTLFLEGRRVSCVVEPLTRSQHLPTRKGADFALRKMAVDARPSTPTGEADPRRVSNGSSLSFSPISSSSHGQSSPRTPPDASHTSVNVLQRPYTYQVPLKTAFLAEFLSSNSSSDQDAFVQQSRSFAKSKAQRSLLGTAMASLTIVQEFVVLNKPLGDAYSLPTENNHVSPGSNVGDVVLVVAWDFECDESLVENPASVTLSVLTTDSPSHKQTTPLPSPLLRFDDTQAEHGFAAPLPTAQAPTLLRKRGMSLNKSNLMLNIPPASMYLNAQNAPNSALLGSGQPHLTPLHSPTPMAWGTMHQRAMRTPLTPLPQQGDCMFSQPPPLNSGDEARLQKERLERLWASKADGMVGPLHSPLEMTFGANATCMPTTASTNMAAAAAANGRASPNPLGLTVPTTTFGLDGSLLSPAHF